MKKLKIFLVLIVIAFLALISSYYLYSCLKTRSVLKDYFHQERWGRLKEEYSKKRKSRHCSLFFGDSMTENFNNYMPASDSIINMGISGDFTEGLIMRINNVIDFRPDQVFIMIGINDIVEKVSLSEIEENYSQIIELIQRSCPATKIYIQSTLPTYGLSSTFSSSKTINKTVQELNSFLKTKASSTNCVFIDMYQDFVNGNNELRPELTADGVHLKKEGYLIWENHIKQYLAN